MKLSEPEDRYASSKPWTLLGENLERYLKDRPYREPDREDGLEISFPQLSHVREHGDVLNQKHSGIIGGEPRIRLGQVFFLGGDIVGAFCGDPCSLTTLDVYRNQACRYNGQKKSLFCKS
ncbi:hypothetical protein CISG_02062 [Coccidioides immitis RMSCC 3703]|uniref:Uncharacterized protein n=2 Tax=Coccidioides immitis TaxID=5501 RepID=A0A0J8R3B5_COCIT|nr:hypothetical protein CIRG_07751 [Coccidioides immitis RMSCC 2394]KMU79644.1 hypothetical protein CISG_02062 [Coccidioides immitis RMSCC 3703]